MNTTTTKIAGEAMTDEWRTAFDDRHEFDVYPEHFMSGLRNEFAAGWHAAMKSQARALLASKPALPMERTPVAWVLPDMGNREYSGVTLTRSKPIAEKHNGKPLYYADDFASTVPAQPMLEKLAGILASEIECDVFEQHVAPALDVARKVFAGHIAPAASCDENATEKADEAVQFPAYESLADDGWTEFVFPEKNYWMQCCDCGLVHELEFSVVKTEPAQGGFHSDELPWPENRVRFRARRSRAEFNQKDAAYETSKELWRAANSVGFGEFQRVVARLMFSSASERSKETLKLPRVHGVSRISDNPCALLLLLMREPGDDDLRAIHDTLAARAKDSK